MGHVVCTSCGTVGRPRSHTPGSFRVEIALWLFFFIPGLIYSIWRLANRCGACSSCKQLTIIPVDSPVGRKLAGESAAQGVVAPAQPIAAPPPTLMPSIPAANLGLGASLVPPLHRAWIRMERVQAAETDGETTGDRTSETVRNNTP